MSETTLPLGGGRRLARARIVAVQLGLGCVLGGLAARDASAAAGAALAGAGALLLAGALLRRRGRWAAEALLRRVRRDALRTGVSLPALVAGARPDRPALGLAHRLLPALDVTEVPDRNGPAFGMLADGRGCAAVLELPGGALPSLPVTLLGRWLAEDPARPAGAQLIVEQFALPPWDQLHGYRPTAAYRQLPAHGVPVAVRSYLVLRHEPLDAPEEVRRRGGGTAGAGAALAAAGARLRARLAEHGGTRATAVGAEDLRDLLRQLGDASPEGLALPGCWAGQGATHATLTAEIGSQAQWARLLTGLASCTADRVVTAASVASDGDTLRVRTAVRLVCAVGAHAAAERDRLVASGLVGPPAADQLAGLLATLPVAYPAHSPAEAAGSALLGGRR